jgi:hypothetical protein
MRATVRARSRPFAQTVRLQTFSWKRANASAPGRTSNFAILATDSGTEFALASLTASGRGCRRRPASAAPDRRRVVARTGRGSSSGQRGREAGPRAHINCSLTAEMRGTNPCRPPVTLSSETATTCHAQAASDTSWPVTPEVAGSSLVAPVPYPSLRPAVMRPAHDVRANEIRNQPLVSGSTARERSNTT